MTIPRSESPEALAALADATEAKTDDTANSGTSTATGGHGNWELELLKKTQRFGFIRGDELFSLPENNIPMTDPWDWSNYSDLTRPHPKWWFSAGNPII